MYIEFDACEFTIEEPTSAEDVKDITPYLVNMDRILAVKESERVTGYTELVFDNGEIMIVAIPYSEIKKHLP